MDSRKVNALSLVILRALTDRPKRASRVVEFIELAAELDRSPLMVFDELVRLENQGLVEPGVDRRRAGYRITSAGRHFAQEGASEPIPALTRG